MDRLTHGGASAARPSVDMKISEVTRERVGSSGSIPPPSTTTRS